MKNQLITTFAGLGWLFFLGISSQTVVAQNPVVTFTVGEEGLLDITGFLPYDQYFDVEVPRIEGMDEVSINYRIVNRKPWHYFPERDSTDTTSTSANFGYLINPINTSLKTKEKFIFRGVGPFHPNTMYEFKVSATFKYPLEEARLAALSTEIGGILDGLTANLEINADGLKQSVIEINKKIAAAYKAQYPDKDFSGKLPQQRLNSPSIDSFLTKLIDNNNLINTQTSDLTSYIKAFAESQNSNREVLSKDLSQIIGLANLPPPQKDQKLDSTQILSPFATQNLNRKVFPHLPAFKTLTLKDAVYLLSSILDDPEEFQYLLLGKTKLQGTTVLNSDEIDSATYLFLMSAFRALSHPNMDKLNGTPLISDQGKELLKGVSGKVGLRKIFDDYQEILSLKADRIKIVEECKIELRTFSEKATGATPKFTKIPVEVNKSPYIEPNIGFSYAPFVGNVYLYQGIDIFFRPVNRSPLAAWSQLKGKDKFWKRFSLTVGIAQVLGPNQDEQFQPLLGGVGTPIMGAGYRFGPMKVELGSIMYLKKNINPIIDVTSLRFTPQVSLSFDIGLLGSFGNFGTKLNELAK
ncbi:MAG: hypothetical protein AAFY70_04580 [Bacteroidota bacterium]